ncbi:MAG: TolB family protein [Cyclobacteriaceae bacterium]
MKHSVVVSLFLITALRLYAQEVLENNPPSLKWNKITTPNFRVLYTAGFEAQAQRMANTLEHIRLPESASLGRPPRKFTVVLQNQSAISNGFVSLLPRRSEFFTMPPQDYNFTGTMDWLNQLAVHEYRHMVQFDRARTGLSKWLYYAFGPATLAGISQMAAPLWFWEGDAVATETAFTNSGRGRIPNFGLLMRTNLMEGREFNYHKQYLRSYKHAIPDHYVLGYHMVSYLRKHTHDPLIWDKITQRSWKFPFWPFAFSNAIHKETGMYVTDLYRAMANDLKSEWNNTLRNQQLSVFEPESTSERKGYTDYKYPQVLSDGSVLAMKRGIGDIEQFVIIGDDRDHRVFTPGIVNDNGMLSAAGTRVVWNEYGFHPRWRRVNYSLIKMYDYATRKLKIVSRNSRYAGAALSPDTTRIVTVESATDYTVSLLVLDTDGKVIKKLASTSEALYSMPRWSDDGTKIVTLKTLQNKRLVVAVDVRTGREQELIPPSDENIGHPVLYKHYLFFNSPVSGIDNIYVVDLASGQRKQVTVSRYGAYNPVISADGTTIYYNEQTRDGFNVVKIPFDVSGWADFQPKPAPKSFFQYLVEQEGKPDLLDSLPLTKYTSGRYRKISGLFNPYSWGAYFNTSVTQADIGIVSQDVLGTVSWRAGYLFNVPEQTGLWRVGVSYQNWFPIIDVNVLFGPRKLNEGEISYYDIVGPDTVLTSGNLTYKWYEKTLEAGLRIPLITTSSRFFGNFSVSNYLGYTQVTDFTNSITGSGRLITPELPQYWLRTSPGNGTLLYNHFSMSAYRLLKRSRRDINSKWGQSFELHGYGTPFKSDYTGNQFSFYSVLYFPGLFRHHSLWGYWAFQQTKIELLTRSSASQPFTDNNSYIFPNQIPLPRGIAVFRDEKFYSMSANYTLPVWYPDIAIGPLLNIQRLRMNGFTDYGFGSSQFGQSQARSTSYLSAGVEIKLDVNILRFLPQFDIGVRYSVGILPNSVTTVEFLLGTINF